MIDDIRCEHLVKHSKISAGNRFGKFSESRKIFVLSHPHSSRVFVPSRIQSTDLPIPCGRTVKTGN